MQNPASHNIRVYGIRALLAQAFASMFSSSIPMPLGYGEPRTSWIYPGSCTLRGRRKHAGECRRIAAHKRYRAFQHGLRGKA
jgi:hypothetical protein